MLKEPIVRNVTDFEDRLGQTMCVDVEAREQCTIAGSHESLENDIEQPIGIMTGDRAESDEDRRRHFIVVIVDLTAKSEKVE